MSEFIMQSGPDELVGKICFTDRISPILPHGDYVISIKTDIPGVNDNAAELTQKLAVSMRPFWIADELIYSFYPPKNAYGVYPDVLPHIVLNSRCFPWERSLEGDTENSKPWVALLIFSLDEGVVCSAVKTNEFKKDGFYQPKFDMAMQAALLQNEECLALDIPSEIFTDVLPHWDELEYLAHARNVSLDNKVTDMLVKDDWFSVITANRFPLDSGGALSSIRNGAYLVSLEGFEDVIKKPHEERDLSAYECVRMVCLTHWDFYCETKTFDFLDVTKNMNVGVLTHDTHISDPALQEIFKAGYTPVNHNFREGSRSVSWYRSPLTPYKSVQSEIDLCQYPDKLLRYDSELHMFDVSYSAAWQLGRLMAMSDKGYSQSLCKWRTANKCKRANEKNNTAINVRLDGEETTYESPAEMLKVCKKKWKNAADKFENICGMSDHGGMKHIIKNKKRRKASDGTAETDGETDRAERRERRKLRSGREKRQIQSELLADICPIDAPDTGGE